jgi:hypothetical protein
MKKNFNNFNARIKMINTFIQNCHNRNQLQKNELINFESLFKKSQIISSFEFL